MNNRINNIFISIKGYSALYIMVSICIFLFILFFQPFPLDRFDRNNGVIFEAGLGVIIFVSMLLLHVIFPLWPGNEKSSLFYGYLPVFKGFGLFAFSSTAFAFYIRYVGGVNISFFLMMKILLICLASPVIIRVFDIITVLRRQNDSLLEEKSTYEKRIEKFEEDYLNISMDFVSENGSEKFTIPLHDVAFIRSADNYVEIVFMESEELKRKLIRNTLKGIEHQLKDYSNFSRCHRICIVNTNYITRLYKSSGHYAIDIKGWGERIPVSRQYILKIKELI